MGRSGRLSRLGPGGGSSMTRNITKDTHGRTCLTLAVPCSGALLARRTRVMLEDAQETALRLPAC